MVGREVAMNRCIYRAERPDASLCALLPASG
jgi:hypothetical protein